EIRALQVVQEAAAPADQLEQAAARVMVVLVRPKMLGQLVDPARQHRDLDFRRAGIRLGPAVLLDDLLLLFLGEGHGAPLEVGSAAMKAGIAAGHPATAAAGAEVLSAGGNAADAAVAATLASCVAETMMTGLLGGGHAVYFDRASGRSWNLDCFCGVPSGKGGDLVELQVPFGEELVHYAIGPASFAVPSVPAGVGALHARFGRLPWRELFEPALRIA